MSAQSRRQFLMQSAVVGSAVVAASGHDAQAEAPSDMCIARAAAAPETDEALAGLAKQLTEQAVAQIGGMKRFVKKGDVVWVKPNIAWDRTPEQAANTNPDVVATVVRLCLEAGAKTVKVGDNTCNDAKKSYERSGIAKAAEEAGAEVVFVDKRRFRTVKIDGPRLDSIPICPEMVEADLLISVPVVKHHGATRCTLTMKNFMGVVENRRKFHQDLPGCIRDLTAYLKPKLAIVDAMRILTANGPTGGNLTDVKAMHTVAAGTDLVALDAFGAELLGNKPDEIGTIIAAYEGGLGEIDYRKLKLREITV